MSIYQKQIIIHELPKTVGPEHSRRINPTEANMNQNKIDRVSKLQDLLSKAKSVAVVDYKGMNVPQATQLRSEVKKVNGEVKVEKNTLFRIALSNQSPVISDQLKGLSAFVFSNTDEVSALKVVSDFIKKNNVLSFKFSVVGDKVLNTAETIKLSQTASKETSVSKILYLLNFNMSKFVRTLDAIAKRG